MGNDEQGSLMTTATNHQTGTSHIAGQHQNLPETCRSLLASEPPNLPITHRSLLAGECQNQPEARRSLLAGEPKNLLKTLLLATLLNGCATTGNTLPSCNNVSGYYHNNIPLGAEPVGSREWIERRLLYSNQIGPVIRATAAGYADAEWEATRLQTPLLVEDGLWKTTVVTGLAGQYPYDVNFDARAWEEPQFSTARIQRRTVEIYLHVFGNQLGNYGLETTLRMAALKYRSAPETDWALCPVRL